MRLVPFLILAYVAVGLQIGLGASLTFHGGKPDLVLLAVIFVAVNAPREPALLGAFGLGLMEDLVAIQPLGLYALCYGLVAMFVVSTQEVVYREHPLTHFSLALIGSMMVGVMSLIHGWIYGARPGIPALFMSALYTAVVAVPVLMALQRTSRVFGFAGRRRLRAF